MENKKRIIKEERFRLDTFVNTIIREQRKVNRLIREYDTLFDHLVTDVLKMEKDIQSNPKGDLTGIATLTYDPLATYSLHGKVTKTKGGSHLRLPPFVLCLSVLPKVFLTLHS